MAKTKKKISPQESQKLATAKHKKEFIKKIKYILDSYSDEDIFSLIPPQILESIYTFRVRSLLFQNEEGVEIEKEIINYYNQTVISILKKTYG